MQYVITYLSIIRGYIVLSGVTMWFWHNAIDFAALKRRGHLYSSGILSTHPLVQEALFITF
jgi:hypothetical protein